VQRQRSAAAIEAMNASSGIMRRRPGSNVSRGENLSLKTATALPLQAVQPRFYNRQHVGRYLLRAVAAPRTFWLMAWPSSRHCGRPRHIGGLSRSGIAGALCA
jgi:hypothetical protein